MCIGPEGVRLEGQCVFLSTRRHSKAVPWFASSIKADDHDADKISAHDADKISAHGADKISAHDAGKGTSPRSGDSGNIRLKSKSKTSLADGKKDSRQPQQSFSVAPDNAQTANQSQRNAAPDSDTELVDLSLTQSQPSHPNCPRLFSKYAFLLVGLGPKDADATTHLIVGHGGRVAAGLQDLHTSEREKVVLAAPTAYREVGYLYAVARGMPPLHTQWVRDCCSERAVLPLSKYELSLGFISRKAKEKVRGYFFVGSIGALSFCRFLVFPLFYVLFSCFVFCSVQYCCLHGTMSFA